MNGTIQYPPDHDRFLVLKVFLGAGAVVLALFVILAAWCALAGRPTRRRVKR